jgi:glutaryl-CoA dehydrogenase
MASTDVDPDVGSGSPPERTQSRRELDPLDVLDLDALLSEEERMIRDAVRDYVRRRVLPDIADHFERGTFPREVFPELGAMGLLGMHLHGYGCAGTNAVSYGLTCLEMEAGDSGFRSAVSVQGSLSMFPIWRFGSEDQKERWLPPMATGEVVGCFGLTEPDFGSDPSRMRTQARRDGSDWILSGAKMWITNGGIADVAVVWARTDDGVRGFVVPTDTPGFSTKDVARKLSLRASVTSELILDEVRLPDEAVLPGVVGLKGPLSCLNEARYGITWGAMGAARACYESALEYSTSRVQFGRPVGGFQLTQRKLVDMMVEIEKGTLLALHLGRMKDEERLSPEQVSLGKLNNVREALKVAREARSVLGANGITLEYPVIRHMNNLESVLTYEGTNEIHTLILGEAITGLRAFE